MDKIAAVVLAAGTGTRMLPLTLIVPKPMLTIGGKNLIEHKLELLPQEVNEVVLVVGYLEEKIRGYFGTEWNGKRLHYVTQPAPNGTAGALWAAKDILSSRFIVMMGDDLYTKQDVQNLMLSKYGICVHKVEDKEISGGVIFTADNKFLNVNESQVYAKTGYINTGLYMLDREIFRHTPVPKSPGSLELGLPQTLALLAKDHDVDVIISTGWFQVSSPEDLVRGEIFLKQKTA